MDKMELIINTPEILPWYIILLIDLGLFLVVCVVGYIIFRNRLKKSNNKISVSVLLAIIWIMSITVSLVSIVGNGTLYSLDYLLENIEVTEECIEDVHIIKSIIEFETKANNSYNFSKYDVDEELTYNDIIKLFEDSFIEHNCEIEYYKWSKAVKRITVLD